MSRIRHECGICHICGKYGVLTYEHVPPQKAFNSHKQFIVYGKELIKHVGSDKFPWDLSNTRRVQKQRGIGFYTLCNYCNNNTGGWYGGAFVDFIYQGYKQLSELRSEKIFKFHFVGIYPNRILKQVLTMFCSINSDGFAKANSDLREIILNKRKKGISNNYALYVYVLRGSICRYLGLCGILNTFNSRQRIVSELSSPPFGFVLELDPEDDPNQKNIVDWVNIFSYDDKTDIEIEIPIYESNTHFPMDYRTKQEVLESYIKSKLDRINKISAFKQ